MWEEDILKQMNNQVLSKTEKVRDIGVIIHKFLKPSLQYKEAANSVQTQIARSSFHYKDRKTLLNLYTTYVRPHIEFSTPAWNPLLKQNQEVLENVQKRAITMISGLNSNNYEDKLKELRMSSLKDSRIKLEMVKTFKIVHEIDRVDRRVWFEFVEGRGERVTRLLVDHLNIKSKLSN